MIPQSLMDLLHVVRLKRQAGECRVTKIFQETGSVIFVLDPSVQMAESALHRLLDRFKKKIRFLSPFSFELLIEKDSSEAVFLEATRCLAVLKKD